MHRHVVNNMYELSNKSSVDAQRQMLVKWNSQIVTQNMFELYKVSKAQESADSDKIILNSTIGKTSENGPEYRFYIVHNRH